MKPEAVLLQKSMDAGQATLANGVLCGDTFQRLLESDYPDYIDFTGRVLDKHAYVDTRQGTEGYLVPEHDEITRIVKNSETVQDGTAGMRILGFAINGHDPSRAVLLLDQGLDPDNPDAEECTILQVGRRGAPNMQHWGHRSEVQVTALKTADVLHPTFMAVLKSWRLVP